MVFVYATPQAVMPRDLSCAHVTPTQLGHDALPISQSAESFNAISCAAQGAGAQQLGFATQQPPSATRGQDDFVEVRAAPAATDALSWWCHANID